MNHAPEKVGEIVLVDDDDADNYVHTRAIKKVGCADSVTVFEDARECLEHLTELSTTRARLPSLIFLDLNMPGMDGWTFLDRCPPLDPTSVLIVLLTTSLNPDDQRRAEALDAVSGFETKPLTEDKLRSILKRWFAERGW